MAVPALRHAGGERAKHLQYGCRNYRGCSCPACLPHYVSWLSRPSRLIHRGFARAGAVNESSLPRAVLRSIGPAPALLGGEEATVGTALNAIRHHVPSANVINLESFVAVEQGRVRLVPKPWGRTDLRPWNVDHDAAAAMGEVWFERSDAALLLKLILPKINDPAFRHGPTPSSRCSPGSAPSCDRGVPCTRAGAPGGPDYSGRQCARSDWRSVQSGLGC